MRREGTLEEISDGKRYGWNDMVKVGCHDCKGCYACCKGMGNSIILDPFDVFCLRKYLGIPTEKLVSEQLELNLVDGVILPNLKMTGENKQCIFLNKEGRCGIYAFRPNYCRMFPLGRYYENRSFCYILQEDACSMKNKTKIKVGKWINISDYKTNEQFVLDWHYFILDLQKEVLKEEPNVVKNLNLYLLRQFFLLEYRQESEEGFYPQFYERLSKAKELLGLEWS